MTASPAPGARIEYVALAALAGNLIAHQLPALPGPALLGFLSLLGVCLCARRGARLCGVSVVFFCLASLFATVRLADRWVDPGSANDVAVRGWVDGFPTGGEDRVVFTLRTTHAASDSLPKRLRLTWYEPPFVPAAGDSLDLTVRLRAPRGLANPGGFDYERWLLVEDIGATGYVREGTRDAPGPAGIAQALLQFRQRVAAAIGQAVDEPAAESLLVALTVGVRTGFGERQWEVLRRTGTSHLVAISGLHVGLIAVLAFHVLLHGVLWLPPCLARRAWPLAAALTLVPAVAYCALAGFALPTMRALVMLVVAQAVIMTRRRVQPFAALGLALVIVLAFDPFATLGASFWLSFAAVTAIIAFVARRAAHEPGGRGLAVSGRARVFRPALVLVQIQLVIGCALLPLAAIFFGEISVAGFPVNLVAVPLFSFVLVPASLLLSIAALVGAGGSALGSVVGPLASAVWAVLGSIADSRFASIELSRPGLFAVALSCAGIMLLFGADGRKRWLGIVACMPLFLRSPARPEPGAFVLTVLDVGHGLAVVVRTATRTLLFDAGPLSRSGFDAGTEIVLPALDALSPGQLDTIVISHGDSDHAGGLDALRERFGDAALVAGPDVDKPDADPCVAGQRWIWDRVEFSVLHPAPGFDRRGNDSSCVLRIDSTAGSALLTGDIERRAESALVTAGLGPVDIVLAPHHGSATSSSAAFVRATRPSHVIVSAAHANRWNFPRPEVVSRWRDAGANIVTTGHSGAVTVSISDAGMAVEQWRKRRIRYWHAGSGAGTSSAL